MSASDPLRSRVEDSVPCAPLDASIASCAPIGDLHTLPSRDNARRVRDWPASHQQLDHERRITLIYSCSPFLLPRAIQSWRGQRDHGNRRRAHRRYAQRLEDKRTEIKLRCASQQSFRPEVRVGSWPCKNTPQRDVVPGSQDPGRSQAAIAAISGLIPTMFMTRVRL
jgi:hypothetical protein